MNKSLLKGVNKIAEGFDSSVGPLYGFSKLMGTGDIYFFVYLSTPYILDALHGRMILNYDLGRMRKEAVVAYTKIICRHFQETETAVF